MSYSVSSPRTRPFRVGRKVKRLWRKSKPVATVDADGVVVVTSTTNVSLKEWAREVLQGTDKDCALLVATWVANKRPAKKKLRPKRVKAPKSVQIKVKDEGAGGSKGNARGRGR